MKRHLSLLLLLSTALTAACQPSQQAVQTASVQTQVVQSAFDAAVAAAQTQAAPTGTPAPTLTPAEAELVRMQPIMKAYLEGKVNYFQPLDGSPYSAEVLLVAFESYDNGNATVMDVVIQKGTDTTDVATYGAVLRALKELYTTDTSDALLGVPLNLRVFRVHLCGPDRKERWRLTGQWADVIALVNGSLSEKAFIDRLQFEQAAD